MLVLTRKINQSIIVGNGVEIILLETKGDQARIGIKAPRSVTVHRKEVYEQIELENHSARNVNPLDLPF